MRVYRIDMDFFNDLAEAGLIDTIMEENTVYLHYDTLARFERLVTWHYDLEINIPGLEVICQLLERIEHLQQQRYYPLNDSSSR